MLGDAFDQLTIGMPVAFVEEQGEKGLQASTVRILGKHHYEDRSRGHSRNDACRNLRTTPAARGGGTSGHDLQELLVRTDDDARRLLVEASQYARKLGEIEARSPYLHKLHGEP